MKKLCIGAGENPKKGWINLDIVKLKGIQVVHDLNNFPYPFKDCELDEIFADNVLEHLNDPFLVMKELHRILKKGGKLFIRVPHFRSWDMGWGNIQHRRPYVYETFDMMIKGTKKFQLDNYFTQFYFRKAKKWIHFEKGLNPFNYPNYVFEPLFNLTPIWYEKYFGKLISSNSFSVIFYK